MRWWRRSKQRMRFGNRHRRHRRRKKRRRKTHTKLFRLLLLLLLSFVWVCWASANRQWKSIDSTPSADTYDSHSDRAVRFICITYTYMVFGPNTNKIVWLMNVMKMCSQIPFRRLWIIRNQKKKKKTTKNSMIYIKSSFFATTRVHSKKKNQSLEKYVNDMLHPNICSLQSCDIHIEF